MTYSKKEIMEQLIANLTAAQSEEEIINLINEFAKVFVYKNDGNPKAYNTYRASIYDLARQMKEVKPTESALKSSHENSKGWHISVDKLYEISRETAYTSLLRKDNQEIPKVKKVVNTETGRKKKVTIDFQKLYQFASEDLINSNNWKDIGFAIMFFSGRRPSEVFFNMCKMTADDKYTMVVQNLSKKSAKNYQTAYRIPVLIKSDLIESARERMFRCEGAIKLNKILHEAFKAKYDEIFAAKNDPDLANIEGLKAARNKFHDKASDNEKLDPEAVTGIGKSFQSRYKDILPLQELNENLASGSMRGLRTIAGSVWYRLYRKRYPDALEADVSFPKMALVHESGETTTGYMGVDFENFINWEKFGKNFFELKNFTMTQEETKTTASSNLVFDQERLIKSIPLDAQEYFNTKLAENKGDLEQALATVITEAYRAQTLMKITKVKHRGGNRTIDVIDLIITYNQTQKEIDNPLYMGLTGSMIDRISKEVIGTRIAPTTVASIMGEYKDKIDAHNLSIGLTDANDRTFNYALRGKMKDVISQVKNLHEQRMRM